MPMLTGRLNSPKASETLLATVASALEDWAEQRTRRQAGDGEGAARHQPLELLPCARRWPAAS